MRSIVAATAANPPRRRATAAAGALALLLASTPAVRAEERESCSRKKEATAYAEAAWCFHSRKWGKSIDWWLEAVRQNPVADAGKTGELVLYDRAATYHYLPYYFLGRCYQELGDCATALACFQKSVEQRQIQKIGWLETELETNAEKCRRQGPAGASKQPVCEGPTEETAR